MWIGCWITHRHGKFDQNKSDFNWMVWKRSKKMTKNWIKIEIKLRIFNQILWWILSVSMDFMVSMVFDRFWYILIDIFNQKWFEIHQIECVVWFWIAHNLNNKIVGIRIWIDDNLICRPQSPKLVVILQMFSHLSLRNFLRDFVWLSWCSEEFLKSFKKIIWFDCKKKFQCHHACP